MEYPGFIGGSYESQAVTADQELTMNWYVEKLESTGATAKAALYPAPGVMTLSSAALNLGSGRAHFYIRGREFAVIGIGFVEIDKAGNVLGRGAVKLGPNPATISSNGDGGGQLFITSGDNGYIFDLDTNTFSEVVALNTKATMGDHLDGFFLALDAKTSTLYISNLLQGLTWDTGTDFAQRSIAPDPWSSMKVSGRYIWLFGTETSELWYNTGGAFPFAAHPSGLIPYGIVAPFSAVVADQNTIWLSTSRKGGNQVVKAAGFTPERISTFPLETAIDGYIDPSDAVADMYMDNGHTFYVLSFPSQDVTHVYDTDVRVWCGRGTWDSANNKFTAWRPRWHVNAYNEHRMLDSVTGSIYVLASTFTSDVDGLPIRRIRRAPAMQKENSRVAYPGFELDVEPGLGATIGQGTDPQVMMRFSDDGGKNWSAERMRSSGKVGEYFHRSRWTRLGSGRRRVFEVSMTDPTAWRITNAYLTPDPIGERG